MFDSSEEVQMKRFDLTTQSGMLDAATTTGGMGVLGRCVDVFAPFGVVEKACWLIKKLLSPEVSVAKQYERQGVMLKLLFQYAKDNKCDVEAEFDDGVLNGIEAEFPRWGHMQMGVRANGKCKVIIRGRG